MGIPIGQRYTATMKGSTMKRADCESCKQAYYYKVERSATGEGSSILWLDNEGASDRASSAAEVALKAALDKAVDLVACPNCGYFQKNMVSRGKWRRFGWTFGVLALVAVILLVIAAAQSDRRGNSSSAFMIAALVTGVAGFVLGVVWFIAYNPNRGHEEKGGRRRDIASASRGIPEETFDAKYNRSDDQIRADMHRALREAMLVTAAADGAVVDVEIESVARLVEQITESRPDPSVLRTEAAGFAGGNEQLHQQFHTQLADLAPYLSDEGRGLFIKASLIVAAADRQVEDAEWDMLAKIGASLNMTVPQINAVIDQMTK
ncbi:MAG: hypothetical protein GC159_08130 [Phycisphaera sp.]|nr:hypothetical protein [Phycisphaera sp.]